MTGSNPRVLPLLGCCLASMLLQAAMAGSSAGGAEASESKAPVDYMIVVTGSELLLGAYPDGHTYFITRTLHPLGLRCVGSMSVDDRRADIQAALRFATERVRLVIVTGGLGPTDNDVTRETLSEFTGVPLEEHDEVLEHMERRFGVSRDRLRANLRRQTRVPTRGTYLRNANGSAVGLVFEADQATIVALPGPPRELQDMVRDELVPYLSRRFGSRLPGCSLTLRFVGIGQSGIDQTLKTHVPLASDITVASQFEALRVDFTFSLPDDTKENRARLERLKHAIVEHLGEYIYADDDTSLEEHVTALLESRGETLALAEVGSGGSVAAALSTADKAASVLAGAFVAPTDDQLAQLLGIEVDRWAASSSGTEKAKLLAVAAANKTGSQWTIAVGEVERDANNPGSVDVVIKLPDGRLESHRMGIRSRSQADRFRLTTNLLDQLRRRLR